MIDGLCAIPEQMEKVLEQSDVDQARSPSKFCERENWLFLGRGYHYPVALEGALKLKEISYIHAEGMPAAEMKHGPIALINEGMPVVFIATKGMQYDKVISNIEEVRARGGKIIAVATEGDTQHPALQRPRHLRPRCARAAAAAAQRRAAAAAGLSRRGRARLQRRQAAESGQERDGGISVGRGNISAGQSQGLS